MKKPPRFPVYDQSKDGNPFQWIIAQAAKLHAKEAEERRNRPRFDPLTGRPIPASVPAYNQTLKR